MTLVGDRIRQALSKNKFLRNVLLLAGGTSLGQAITFLASPVLTRLYSPDDFGILAIYISILSLMAVMVTWRYEFAIPLAEDEVEAANLLTLVLSIVGSMSLVCGLLIWFLGEPLLRLAHQEVISPYLWPVPLSLLWLGGYQALNYWGVRKQAFDRIARTKINQGFGQVVTQIALGFFGFKPIGLLLGDVVGRASGTATLARLAWQNDRDAFRKVTPSRMLQAAHRFRRFPLLASWSALLNTAGLQAPALLLAVLYGTRTAGYFTFGYRLVQAPLMLVGQAVSQVYFGEASRLATRDPVRLYRLFRSTIGRMFLLGVAPLAILAVAGTKIFVVVFGVNWAEAGLFVQILSLTFLADMIGFPVAQTLIALERQDLQFMWDLGRLLAVVFSLCLSSWLHWSARSAITLLAVAKLTAYVTLPILSSYAIRQRIRQKGAETRPGSGASTPGEGSAV